LHGRRRNSELGKKRELLELEQLREVTADVLLDCFVKFVRDFVRNIINITVGLFDCLN